MKVYTQRKAAEQYRIPKGHLRYDAIVEEGKKEIHVHGPFVGDCSSLTPPPPPPPVRLRTYQIYLTRFLLHV
jgi:hypothetical protein